MKRAIWFFPVIAVFPVIFFFQNRLTKIADSEWKTENLSIVPGNESIKYRLLGFQTTYSNILWIKTLIYFGDHYLTDKNYHWLVKMVDMVTKTNPLFYPAYEFAGVMLPEICNDPDAARVILERGLFHIGDKKWNIAFYLSMLFYKYYGQNEIAADYMALSSMVNGAPRQKLASIAAALYKKAGLENTALDFLVISCLASENPEVKTHLERKIKELKKQYRNGSAVAPQ